MDDILLDCFTDLLEGYGEGTGWRLGRDQPLADGSPAVPDTYIEQATLWGGNLAMLVSLLLLGSWMFTMMKEFTLRVYNGMLTFIGM